MSSYASSSASTRSAARRPAAEHVFSPASPAGERRSGAAMPRAPTPTPSVENAPFFLFSYPPWRLLPPSGFATRPPAPPACPFAQLPKCADCACIVIDALVSTCTYQYLHLLPLPLLFPSPIYHLRFHHHGHGHPHYRSSSPLPSTPRLRPPPRPLTWMPAPSHTPTTITA